MKAIRYTKRLISFDSTSQNSNRLVSRYLEMKLIKHGFIVERVEYRDRRNVRKVNLVAKKGMGAGGLAYFGHSDVVPAKKWFSDQFGPFDAVQIDQRIYGRGSCDMKGSIAAMLDAAQRIDTVEMKQPLYFVVTADEEIGFHGARCVVEESKQFREMVRDQTKAIIGEPTELEIVHAHKGSTKIVAKSYGEAAHSSTAAGKNANLAMIPFLTKIKSIIDETEQNTQWQNDLFDPPTLSWNLVMKDNAPALNIKPSMSTCVLYLRTMPEVDVQPLIQRICAYGQACHVKIKVRKFAEPFYASSNSPFVTEALQLANREIAKTVSYGTDAGLLTELEDKIVCGPGSIEQAHTENEWIDVKQLEAGADLYEKMIRHWCT